MPEPREPNDISVAAPRAWAMPRSWLIALIAALIAVPLVVSQGWPPKPKSPVTAIAARTPSQPRLEKPQSIAARWQQANAGQFPIIESDIRVQPSSQEASQEVLSQVGVFALPDGAAQRLEAEESWGVAGEARNEFVMYVHNSSGKAIVSLVVSLRSGACSVPAAGPGDISWLILYLGDAIQPGARALVHAKLPTSYLLSEYCVLIERAFGAREAESLP
jgi:hypothetical protein